MSLEKECPLDQSFPFPLPSICSYCLAASRFGFNIKQTRGKPERGILSYCPASISSSYLSKFIIYSVSQWLPGIRALPSCKIFMGSWQRRTGTVKEENDRICRTGNSVQILLRSITFLFSILFISPFIFNIFFRVLSLSLLNFCHFLS